MKKFLLVIMAIFSSIIFADEVVVYGPSTEKWIGKKFAPIFKEKTGHDLKYVSKSGIVPLLVVEKNKPNADVVVGLTDVAVEVALKKDLLATIDGKNKIPYDYSYLAINYNKDLLKNPPKDLNELKKMKNTLLIENPLTSNTGEEALLWSIAMYGKNWKNFWMDLKPAIKNVEAGWTEAFNKFAVAEAPMMIGYATSNIYFVQDENQKNRFDSFHLADGSYKYNEYAGIVKKENIKPATLEFIKMLNSKEFQALISQNNVMYPIDETLIDKSFDVVPHPHKVVELTKEQIEDLTINLDKYKKEMINILK